MPQVTEIFRECHRLRKHLRDLQTEIDRGPRVLKGRQETLEDERSEHKSHHDSITKLKLKQREDEVTLKSTETRLAKLEQQLTGISVQKEYAAKESEIAQAKANRSELEDAILTTIGTIEEKMAQIPAVEKKWADAQTEFAEFQKEAAERFERLKADQEHSRQELAKVEAEIPEEVRSKYDSLVKAHGPDALSAVKGRACQSCRTSLSEQRWNQLRNGNFMICPHCGKLLYPTE
jgi:predicted  nucleic acid-binding Zn-ribbon protein